MPITSCTQDHRQGRAPTRPFWDTRPMGGWASFSFFCSGREGGRRLNIHAGPGGWAVEFSTGRPWASPGFWPFFLRETRLPFLSSDWRFFPHWIFGAIYLLECSILPISYFVGISRLCVTSLWAPPQTNLGEYKEKSRRTMTIIPWPLGHMCAWFPPF